MSLVRPARLRPSGRVETKSAKEAPAVPVKFPAPLAGWVENQNLATNGTGAVVCENMFPTSRGLRVRGGSTKVATVGARARSMFTYETATVAKLFCATGSAIYDITAMDPNTVPSAAVSGLASGYFSTEQMGTVGGEFLYAVNGTDSARLFNGATWTTITGVSTPAITGITTSTLSFVWKHKNRLWFVEKNTKNAWYLPVDSVGGAAAQFSLAGVFQKGGALLFGVTWSQDSGDGMDDRIVFVSTEGEIAVYQGTNPASATDWGLVGLYNMPAPRGKKCHIRAGGDVIIGTDAGAIPLSASIDKDPAALSAAAVSSAIETSWLKSTRTWDAIQAWEMVKWPQENMLIVSLPHEGAISFVANIQTGRWAKYIGWDAQCFAVFDERLYFADISGNVFAAERGGTDNGAAYIARLSYIASDFESPAQFKVTGLMRGTFQAVGTPVVQLSASSDYSTVFPALPNAFVPSGGAGAKWDVSLWDQAKWDDDGLNNYLVKPTYTTGWVPVAAQGYALSPQMQMVISGTGRPDVELVQIDMMIEAGGAVG